MDASKVDSDIKILQYYIDINIQFANKYIFSLDYDFISPEKLKCTDPMLEYVDGVGRPRCIMRCNELENCNFLSSYKNKGCYLYETCNDKFTTPKKRKLYQKPIGRFVILEVTVL